MAPSTFAATDNSTNAAPLDFQSGTSTDGSRSTLTSLQGGPFDLDPSCLSLALSIYHKEYKKPKPTWRSQSQCAGGESEEDRDPVIASFKAAFPANTSAGIETHLIPAFALHGDLEDVAWRWRSARYSTKDPAPRLLDIKRLKEKLYERYNLSEEQAAMVLGSFTNDPLGDVAFFEAIEGADSHAETQTIIKILKLNAMSK